MSRPAPAKPQPSPSASAAAEGAWAAKMDRLRRRPRPQSTLRICDDDQLRQRFEETEQAARRARFLTEATPGDEQVSRQATDAAAAHDDARAAVAASEFLVFRALPRPVLEELISEHPPTEQQAEEGAIFNPDSFPAALVAAASADGMNRGDAKELLNTWSAPDANALWEAAWQVQQESRVELGKD